MPWTGKFFNFTDKCMFYKAVFFLTPWTGVFFSVTEKNMFYKAVIFNAMDRYVL